MIQTVNMNKNQFENMKLRSYHLFHRRHFSLTVSVEIKAKLLITILNFQHLQRR